MNKNDIEKIKKNKKEKKNEKNIIDKNLSNSEKHDSKDLLEKQLFMSNWSREDRIKFAKYKIIRHFGLKRISEKIASKSYEDIIEYNEKYFKKLKKVEKNNELCLKK
ncbi:hypothetical protein DMUE_2693 [Dictyocoela muelleri]|nr:hypothetical protein DMUE_2693 [Dictyocoela muelleri]